MSNIDNRIVQMQFENSQFEKGVKESTKSLENFKKTLDFKEIQKAGDSFSLAKMAQGIDDLNKRFSALGIAGMRVIQNLTDKAMNIGTNFVKSVSIDQISSGFEKYADKTKAVQTIVNATGKDIGFVDDQLSKLAWFTDETSYNFVDMVSNIGKFTSMNIPLDTSVTAMQGIATWAAASGQGINEASRAMYNLSQAVGAGAVKLIDWKSIQNANMATAEFKQTAIDVAKELGTLSKAGKAGSVTIENFDQTLQKGWFTRDVLLKTLEKYGEYADAVYKVASEEGIPAAEAMDKVSGETMKLGEKAFKAAQEAKTFIEAIDATKDAVSTGWMNTFENIFGNYEEAKVLWTDLANDLWEIFASGAELRNELLKGWKEEGGRDDLISGLSDAMESLIGIINGVKEAFHNIFPETTVEDLKKISSAVKNLGEKLKEAFTPKLIGHRSVTDYSKKVWKAVDPLGDLKEDLKKGMRGDEVRQLQERLQKLGYDLGSAGADGIFGPKTQEALNKFKEQYGLTVDGVYDEITQKNLGEALGLKGSRWIQDFERIEEDIYKYPPGLQMLIRLASGLFAVLGIGAKIIGFLFNVGKKILSVFSPIGNLFGTLADAASRFFVALNDRLGKSQKFTEWLDKLDTALKPVRDAIQSACDWILNFLGLSGDLNDIDFSQVVENLIQSVKAFFGFGIDPSAVGEGIDKDKIVSSIKEKVIGIYTSIKEWITSLFSGDSKGTDANNINFNGYNLAIGAITAIMALITGKFLKAVGTVITFGHEVNGILKNFRKILAKKNQESTFKAIDSVATSLLKFAGAIALIAASLYFLSQLSWKQLSVGLVGLFAILGSLAGFMFLLKIATKDFKNIDKVAEPFEKIAGAVSALSVVVIMLSKLSWGDMFKGLIGLAAIMGLISLFLLAIDKIKIDEKEASKTIGLIISIATALSMLVNSVAKLGALDASSLIKGLAGMSAIMIAVSLFMKSINGISISTGSIFGLLAMAVALDLLVLGFVALTYSMKLMSPGDIAKGTAAMAIMVVSMVGVLKLISKINPSTSAVLALLPLAIALDLVIAGFVAMVAVMKFASIGDIIKAAAGMTIMLVSMIGVTKVLEKIQPNVKASLKAALSIVPLALALALVSASFIGLLLAFKGASAADLIKTIVAFGFIVQAMVRLTKILSSETIKPNVKAVLSLIPMAIALAIAAGAFAMLAFVMKGTSFGTLVKTIIGFGAIIVALSVFSKNLSSISGGGIRKSITLLISSLSMVLAMVAFAIALHYIKDIDAGKIIAFATGLSLIMLAFGALSLMASFAGPTGILLAAGAVLAIGAALALLIAAVSYVLQLPGVEDFLSRGAEKFGRIIGTFTGAMKAAEMKAFSKGMEGFKDVSEADEGAVKNAVKCAQLFADFANGLPDKDVGTRILEWLTESKVERFATDMKAFAVGFNKFAEEISKVKETKDVKKKTDQAVKISKAISAFSSDLPEDTLADKLFGGELDTFSGDMVTFAEKFNEFAAEINRVNDPGGELESKSNFAVRIANALKDLTTDLPEDTMVDKIFGGELSTFSTDMSTFGAAFNEFATQIKLINDPGDELEEKATQAVTIASALSTFSSGLSGKTIDEKITEFFTGTTMDNFTKDTLDFAEGFNSFATEMAKIDYSEDLETGVTDAVKIATQVANFLAQLNALDIEKDKGAVDKWITGDTSQGTVFNAVGTLADTIKENQGKFKGLTGGSSTIVADVKAATDIARSIANLLNYINNENIHISSVYEDAGNGVVDKFYNLMSYIREMAEEIKRFSETTEGADLSSIASILTAVTDFISLIANNPELSTESFLSDLDADEVISKLSTFTTTVGQALTENSESLSGYTSTFNDAGANLANSLSNGLASNADTSGVDKLVSASLRSASSYERSFERVGSSFAVGLGNGISNSKSFAVSAAEMVANAVKNKVQEVFDSHSPSRVAAKLGSFFTIGLANGTEDEICTAESASEKVAKSMINTAGGTLSSLSSLLASDIDDNPVVRPVVDLTNARLAASSIGGMFGTQTFGVQSRIMASKVNPANSNRPVTNQNGSANVVGAVNDMNDRIGALGDAISSMQMVVDTGALVGQVANKMDQKLGVIAARKGRLG